MAVDANILIFSRMREEIRESKDLLLSVENALVVHGHQLEMEI
jgi:preprotein translocase subunit SecD